ncbi:MAG: dihydropteroate synthase [Acidobacteriota bacterium]
MDGRAEGHPAPGQNGILFLPLPGTARLHPLFGVRAFGLSPRQASVLEEAGKSVASLGPPLWIEALSSPAGGLTIHGPLHVFFHLLDSLGQWEEMGEVASALADTLDRSTRRPTLMVRGRNLFERSPHLLMGVVNVTPDSFSDGGRFLAPEAAVAHALRLAQEGADLLDLGAESSRPGSDPVPAEEELRRLVPPLRELHRLLPDLPISVDTTKAVVAEAALEAGADLVNDISAGCLDASMVPLCARRRVPLILMHMRGLPKTMQESPHYDDPVAEVTLELRKRVRTAEAAGLGAGTLVVDPGFGFAKRPEDNLALVAELEGLRALGYPVLLGASRKSTIGALTGADAADRLPGTLALHTAALLHGASILRVHDVKEHRQALACAAALMGKRSEERAAPHREGR